MNFDDAVKAHIAWKQKLQTYIQNPDNSLNPATVGVDNMCELGKWLHGEGAKFASNPNFKSLVAEHAKFHQAAAEIIKKADSGQDVNAEVTLGSNSPFVAQSEKVKALLTTCKKECV